MKIKLTDQIISSDDLRQLIEELKDYIKWFNHEKISKKVSKSSTITKPEFSEQLNDLLSLWHDKKEMSSLTLDALMDELSDYIEKAPRMSITLAALPTTKIKIDLTQWCRKNVSPEILIDFKYNRTILGGMIISYKSHIYDLSYRRRLLASKDKVIGALANV